MHANFPTFLATTLTTVYNVNKRNNEATIMLKTPETQANAHAAYRQRERLKGVKNLSLVLPPELAAAIEHLKATEPGGFNASAFVRRALEDLARQRGLLTDE